MNAFPLKKKLVCSPNYRYLAVQLSECKLGGTSAQTTKTLAAAAATHEALHVTSFITAVAVISVSHPLPTQRPFRDDLLLPPSPSLL